MTATKVKRYRVTAAYVMAKVNTGNLVPARKATGVTQLGYYKGAILPEQLAAGEAERLLAKGMIEAVEVDG